MLDRADRDPAELPALPGRAEQPVTVLGVLGCPRAASVRPASRFPTPGWSATPTRRRAAAEAIGYPVVLKALGLLHKSDAGGVALGLPRRRLTTALTRMQDA